MRNIYPPGEEEGVNVAIRDIQPGEELTDDYREFDGDVDVKVPG